MHLIMLRLVNTWTKDVLPIKFHYLKVELSDLKDTFKLLFHTKLKIMEVKLILKNKLKFLTAL